MNKQSAKWFFPFIISLYSLVTILPVWANSDSAFFFGFDIKHFDYKEKLQAPAKSNERGQFPGVLFEAYTRAKKGAYYAAQGSLNLGKTRYDGSLQDHTGAYLGDYKSKTYNVVADLEGRLGYTHNIDKHLITPFIHLGESAWRRDLSHDPHGILEIYYWLYAGPGILYNYEKSSKVTLGVEFKLMQMLYGEMDAKELSIYAMTLGNKPHYELSFPVTFKNNQKGSTWKCNLYLRHLEFGASDIVPSHHIFSFVSEPSSKTNIIGVQILRRFR